MDGPAVVRAGKRPQLTDADGDVPAGLARVLP